MSFLEILLIAISLSMDAFAVSICKGMITLKNINKEAVITGIYFGFFQGLMPFLGYLIGNYFSSILDKIDHFVIFFFLSFIGLSMIKDSFEKDDSILERKSNLKEMLILSIATSIDALVIGITLAFLKTNIIFSIFIISITCFIITVLGVKIGSKIGSRYEKKAAIIGGIILIIIAFKILLEHLGIL